MNWKGSGHKRFIQYADWKAKGIHKVSITSVKIKSPENQEKHRSLLPGAKNEKTLRGT